jgi:hypothetical protein
LVRKPLVPTECLAIDGGDLSDLSDDYRQPKRPGQLVVLDDHTIRIDFLRKDKLTLPDLAVLVPAIFNWKLAQSNATDKDPWGPGWTKTTTSAAAPTDSASAVTLTLVSIHVEESWFHCHNQLQRRMAPPVMPPSITSSAPVM